MFRIKCPLCEVTGYGKMSIGFIRGLLQLKVPFYIQPVDNIVSPGFPEDLRKLIDYDSNIRVGLFIGFANKLYQLNNNVKLLYSMYECTNLNPEFFYPISIAHHVIVPSTFVSQIFDEYAKSISIVHPSIDTTIYKPMNLPRNNKFTIGTAGVMTPRKGIDLLLEAYKMAFPSGEDTELWIKTMNTNIDINETRDDIKIFDEVWSEYEMAEFYNRIDLFALPSRGEGFGLPQIEAACCGTPVITTRWSGMCDYIDDKYIFGIEIERLERTPNMQFASNGLWSVPSIDDIAQKLIFFYNNRERIDYDNFHWQHINAAKRLFEVIKKWL